MAFDGITIYCLVRELHNSLAGKKIGKIAQPEKEELLFTFKGSDGVQRLLISANASLPFLYLSGENKPGPLQAPNFCMLLRKYIGNGRILSVTQPGMERVVCLTIEHLDELGDRAQKKLYVELMGKHSNIIFCGEDGQIIDSIKHIGAQTSSVREVLPGRTYFIPAQEGRLDPWTIDQKTFCREVFSKPLPLQKAVYTTLTGFSPVAATELAYRAGLDGDAPAAAVAAAGQDLLFRRFQEFLAEIENGARPGIYLENETNRPLEFSCVPLTIYNDCGFLACDSVSSMLEQFFAQRNRHTLIRQKSSNLRHIVSVHLERARKKYSLQERQLKDTEKKDRFRVYGELLHTYGCQASPGAKSLTARDYYTDSDVTIPLDPTMDAMENAKRYFDRYAKLKRTQEALSSQIEETRRQIDHLMSMETALALAENEADLNEIKAELQEYGFIKKNAGRKKEKQAKSRPLHFTDPNGFHLYVGKNNYQNDQLTFKIASGNDWWFHSKGIPGSHVIVKTSDGILPDSTFEYAASLAAYYSGGRDSDKVEIDYLQKKNVKKPNNAPPGFVIYYTNYSMMAAPSLDGLHQIKD